MAITVTALHLTPVKALRIRAVDSIELGPSGARGDRAFYVVDEQGAMVNGKRIGALQTVNADYDDVAGTLALDFPNGERCEAPVRLGSELETTFFDSPRRARLLDGPWAVALSRHLGRRVRLVADGSSIDRPGHGGRDLAHLPRLARAARPRRRTDWGPARNPGRCPAFPHADRDRRGRAPCRG
jgi:uncharacterized protein YcbX